MSSIKIRSGETIVMLILIFFTLFVGTALLQAPKFLKGFKTYNATFAGVQINVLIADDNIKRRLGLSTFKRLPKNQAMLFVFSTPEKWRVSTKSLSFPIDIFWLDENLKVVDIYKYAPPGNFIFSPSKKAKYILQTNADFADIYGIQIGDELKFEP